MYVEKMENYWNLGKGEKNMTEIGFLQLYNSRNNRQIDYVGVLELHISKNRKLCEFWEKMKKKEKSDFQSSAIAS